MPSFTKTRHSSRTHYISFNHKTHEFVSQTHNCRNSQTHNCRNSHGKYWHVLTKIYTVKDNQATLVSCFWEKQTNKKKTTTKLIWAVELLIIPMQVQWIKVNTTGLVQSKRCFIYVNHNLAWPGNLVMNLRSLMQENYWVDVEIYFINFSRKPVKRCRYWVMRETQENKKPTILDMRELF